MSDPSTPANQARNLYDYFDAMRERPGMYIGRHSVSALHDHVAGYRMCAFWHGIEDAGFARFARFNAFIRARVDFAESTAGWGAMLLAAHGGDESRALDAFFEDFDVYRGAMDARGAEGG